MAITTTVLTGPPGSTLGAVAITIDTVLQTEDVKSFLVTPAGVANGVVQADYTLNPTTGAPTLRDTVYTSGTGATTATYFGDEATNPVILAAERANPTGFPGPANPGYMSTQYSYAPNGGLTQIVAHDFSGHTYVSTGNLL